MIRYASASGIALPGRAVDTVDLARAAALHPADVPARPLSELTDAHRQLAAAVAPATPNTIQLLADEQAKGVLRYFGAKKYGRLLSMIAAVLFLAFVVMQMLIAPPGGDHRYLDVLVIALTSLVGGIFYVMFAMSKQLSAGAFKRSLEGQYTMLVILGGLAGTALAFLVIRPDTNGTITTGGFNVVVTRPLLALLGGFSAQTVYRILQRLVATLEALVQGSGEEMVAAQQRAAQAHAAAEALSTKAETVQGLIDLASRVTANTDGTTARAMIDGAIGNVLREIAKPTPALQPQGEL